MSAAAANLSIVHKPKVRLAVPILDDYCYLARRMRPDEIAQFLAMTGASSFDSDAAARAMAASQGATFVGVDRDNVPIMAGGLEPLRPGVFELWAVGTLAGWEAHWRAITLGCNRIIRDAFARGAHRVQITALASRTQAHEWYERGLKLRREAEHPGFFADGQTGITFARVKEAGRVQPQQ